MDFGKVGQWYLLIAWVGPYRRNPSVTDINHFKLVEAVYAALPFIAGGMCYLPFTMESL